MSKLFVVVDLLNGLCADREGATLTVDVPPGFDLEKGVLSVNPDRIGRYQTAAGEARVYMTAPRRLSRRLPGEECLVAALEVDSSGPACVRNYSRSMVNPPG